MPAFSSADTGVILIQSLPMDGNISLKNGGFSSTMTASELVAICKQVNGIKTNERVRIFGIGATAGLGNEIVYLDGKLLQASADSGEMKTEELPLNTPISFSQIALIREGAVTRTEKLPVIDATLTTTLDPCPALTAAIQNNTSSVVRITAEAEYVKSRTVCPIIEETGKKLTFATNLATMVAGGKVVLDQEGKTVAAFPAGALTSRELAEQLAKYEKNTAYEICTVRGKTAVNYGSQREPVSIVMVGVVTGKDMAENNLFHGMLHAHCDKGHIEELGTLRNVTIEITKIDETRILLPQRKPNGEPIWHTALKQDASAGFSLLVSAARGKLARTTFAEALENSRLEKPVAISI